MSAVSIHLSREMTTNVHLLCEHLTNNGVLGDTVPNAPEEGVVKILKQELNISFVIWFYYHQSFHFFRWLWNNVLCLLSIVFLWMVFPQKKKKKKKKEHDITSTIFVSWVI